MENTTMTLKNIAIYFKKDHSTCVYSHKTIKNLIETDRKIIKEYDEIMSRINRIRPIKLKED